MQSDTVQSRYGRVKAGTSPVGIELRKKLKDLSGRTKADTRPGGWSAQKTKGPECDFENQQTISFDSRDVTGRSTRSSPLRTPTAPQHSLVDDQRKSMKSLFPESDGQGCLVVSVRSDRFREGSVMRVHSRTNFAVRM
jgi:hypothetical protein